MLREQPLVLGAIGLAAGAVIGAAMPPTEAEDSVMGPARDRLKDRAKAKGKEAYASARERAEDTADRAKQGAGKNRTSKSELLMARVLHAVDVSKRTTEGD